MPGKGKGGLPHHQEMQQCTPLQVPARVPTWAPSLGHSLDMMKLEDLDIQVPELMPGKGKAPKIRGAPLLQDGSPVTKMTLTGQWTRKSGEGWTEISQSQVRQTF